MLLRRLSTGLSTCALTVSLASFSAGAQTTIAQTTSSEIKTPQTTPPPTSPTTKWRKSAGISSDPTASRTPRSLAGANPLIHLPTAASPNDAYLFNFQGVGEDLGQRLASTGIYLKGGSQQILNGLVSGGLEKPGAYVTGFSALGFDLDLQRIAGIHGGAIHVLASFANGEGGSYYAGSHLNDVLGWAYRDGARLEEFSYEQFLAQHHIRLLVGRISPMWDFTQVDHLSCQFTAMLCPAPRAYLFNSQRETYEVGTWGGLLEASFFRRIGYVKLGAYENEPLLATHQDTQLGWPGTDWQYNKWQGTFLPLELGYKTNINDERHPSGGFIGGWLDTARTTDYLLNQKGQSFILHGGTHAVHRDLTGAYVGWQRLMYRSDRTTNRGITFLTQFQWDTSGGKEYVAWDGVVGLLGLGPFASRPNDQWALAVSYNQIDPRVVQAENQTLQLHHIGGRMTNGEPSFLVQYGVAVAPGIMVRPFAQYILHPDQLVQKIPNPNVTHAVTVGINLLLNFNTAFGLPTLGRCAVACQVPSNW